MPVTHVTQILNPGGCSGCGRCECECERGERGKRGKRGHEGPPGPPGRASGGLLKFSGEVLVGPGQTLVSYLADTGIDVVNPTNSPTSYPVAVARNLRNMATNLRFYTVQQEQSVLVELVKNLSTSPVVVASILYLAGETGVKTTLFGPELFAGAPTPDTFDLRVTTTNLNNEGAVNLSATVGVE
jgi:hypothetical protein